MEEEKSILSQNLTALRKTKKLTQIELAQVLNYSDKSVSRWENGDTEPDLNTLITLSEFFCVTLDDLCKTRLEPQQLIKQMSDEKERKVFSRNKKIITCLSVVLVWFIALFVFIQIQLIYNTVWWMAFIWALPASCILLTVFCSIWSDKKMIFFAVSFLVWTLLLSLHLQFTLLGYSNFWILYFLGVPCQIAIVLWSQLHIHTKR